MSSNYKIDLWLSTWLTRIVGAIAKLKVLMFNQVLPTKLPNPRDNLHLDVVVEASLESEIDQYLVSIGYTTA